MNSCRLFVVLALPWLAVAAEEPPTRRAMILAQEANQAAEEKNHAAWLAKIEEATALRPDVPRMLVSLAAAQLANEKPDEAIATLERVANLGVYSGVDKAEEFAGLRDHKEFQAVAKKFAANNRPAGKGEIAFTLREVTGLIEGIAWRESSEEFYFGDVNGRAVWVRGPKEAKDGKPRRLTPEGEDLYGVFGLAIDEARGTLWAATSAVPAMQGYSPDLEGTAGLAEIDLDSGAVRRVLLLPKKAGDRAAHVLGDLALAPDGSVFLSDSGAPILWRLAPGADELAIFAEDQELMSPQGLVILPDQDAIVLADYVNGLVRVDLRSAKVQRIEGPNDTTLAGIDGLARAPDGTLVAIQNGIRPNRVLQLTLDASAETATDVKVLESAHLQMGDPTLGCIGPGGDYHFIGNAGWSRFETRDGPTPPRAVAIFKTKL